MSFAIQETGQMSYQVPGWPCNFLMRKTLVLKVAKSVKSTCKHLQQQQIAPARQRTLRTAKETMMTIADAAPYSKRRNSIALGRGPATGEVEDTFNDGY